MFKIDPHVHTAETSPCGKLYAKELVSLYLDEGFDSIVITDHYTSYFFNLKKYISWDERIVDFLKGYHTVKRESENTGLNIILGMEITFTHEGPNDYLVYGIDEDFLFDYPSLDSMCISEFKEFADKHSLAVFQAHPFRLRMKPLSRELVHGCEVFNGNPRHNSQNELALQHALDNNLKMISGSDCHQPQDAGLAGIICSRPAADSHELASLLLNGQIKQYNK